MTESLPPALLDLCASLFPRDVERLLPTTPFTDLHDWDSLARINLLLGIEKAFSVRITTPEAAKLRTFGDVLDVISEKRGN